jgi:hypothetical protein
LAAYLRVERPPALRTSECFVVLHGPTAGRAMTEAGLRSVFRYLHAVGRRFWCTTRAVVSRIRAWAKRCAFVDVLARIEEIGSLATLVTVTSDGSPLVSSVLVTGIDAGLGVRVGARTRDNLLNNQSLTLSWIDPSRDYQLIVDGTGSIGVRLVRMGCIRCRSPSTRGFSTVSPAATIRGRRVSRSDVQSGDGVSVRLVRVDDRKSSHATQRT